jgi:hypothetical protein
MPQITLRPFMAPENADDRPRRQERKTTNEPERCREINDVGG